MSYRSSSSATLTQSVVKCRTNITLTDGGQPSSKISPVETAGGNNADASCCYLRIRDSVGCNDMLDDGLRGDIGFSRGTQFLEGMIDAHLRLSVQSILACLW